MQRHKLFLTSSAWPYNSRTALRELRWLAIVEQIQYKLCLLVHKLFVGQAAKYITTVFKETETHWSLWRGSSTFLPGGCPTYFGVRMPGLAHEPYERTVEVAWEYPAPCSPNNIVGNVSYEVACDKLNLSTFADWRASICSTLFRQITCESHVLHYLLPAQRDTLK